MLSNGVRLAEFAGNRSSTVPLSPTAGTPPALQLAALVNRSLIPFPLHT